MTAKPMKTLELHYPMIQFLIMTCMPLNDYIEVSGLVVVVNVVVVNVVVVVVVVSPA